MDIKLKVLAIIASVAFILLALTAIDASKHNKHALWIALFFGGVAGVMIFGVYNNCNYGVCNL